jgi:hypothetical protein
MAPPRSMRALHDAAEAPPGEVLDAMRAYAEIHQVQPMLHLLLTRLLEAQPLDPFAFLIQVVQSDPELDALELKARANRFDLRREKTKKALVVALYKRLVALQRRQHGNKETAGDEALAAAFLLSQLKLEETREHMKTQFPKHYRDLIRWFFDHEKELQASIPPGAFTTACMAVLAEMAQA